MLADLPEACAFGSEFLNLVPVKDLLGPSKLSPFGTSPRYACPYALTNQIALKFAQGSQDVHQESSSRGSEIYALGQGDKGHPERFQLAQGQNQVT